MIHYFKPLTSTSLRCSGPEIPHEKKYPFQTFFFRLNFFRIHLTINLHSCIFLQSQRNYFFFLWKHCRISLHIVDFYSGFKVQIAVSTQLQKALHNPSQGIRDLSSETIGNFIKNKKQTCIYFFKYHAWCRQKYRPSVYQANMQRKSNVLYKNR